MAIAIDKKHGEMHLPKWLASAIERVFLGPSKRGERIYDKEVGFTTTRPKGYSPNDRLKYNDWITWVHRTKK